jgi:hypothetical protein
MSIFNTFIKKDPSEIYDLQKDTLGIKTIQNSTGYIDIKTGLPRKNVLLPGTNSWFKAINSGEIPYQTLRGKIKEVYMSGHNDFPEVSIENKEGITTWMRLGSDEEYRKGRNIEIDYVEYPAKWKYGGSLKEKWEYVVKIRIFD